VFFALRITAPVGIDALLRAETPAISELRELPLQHLPASFDCGHVLDELTDLSRERVIARRTPLLIVDDNDIHSTSLRRKRIRLRHHYFSAHD
jgi:hypothetical protein